MPFKLMTWIIVRQRDAGRRPGKVPANRGSHPARGAFLGLAPLGAGGLSPMGAREAVPVNGAGGPTCNSRLKRRGFNSPPDHRAEGGAFYFFALTMP
jgi:hypothetical protein